MRHKIEGLLVGKTYTLREEIAPDSFVRASDIQFTVKNTSEVQKVQMIDKIVEVIKTDLTTGEELEGAKLQVIDKDGKIVDEWVSEKEPHKIKGLEENKTYKLIEITAPYGFEIAEKIEFIITDEKENQKIEMKDMPILSDEIIKVEINDKGLFVNENILEETDENIYDFDYENAPIETPNTNDNRNNTLLKIIAEVSAFALAILGVYGIRKRNNI